MEHEQYYRPESGARWRLAARGCERQGKIDRPRGRARRVLSARVPSATFFISALVTAVLCAAALPRVLAVQPAAPTGVQARATGRSGVLVTWDAVPGATYYQVFASLSGDDSAVRDAVLSDRQPECGGRPFETEAADDGGGDGGDAGIVATGWVAESYSTSAVVACALGMGGGDAGVDLVFRVRAVAAASDDPDPSLAYGSPQPAALGDLIGPLSGPSEAVLPVTRPTPPRQVRAVAMEAEGGSGVDVVVAWAHPLSDGGGAGISSYRVTLKTTGDEAVVPGTDLSVTLAGVYLGEGLVHRVQVTAERPSGVASTTSAPVLLASNEWDSMVIPHGIAPGGGIPYLYVTSGLQVVARPGHSASSVEGEGDFLAVAVSKKDAACGIKTDVRVYCWGAVSLCGRAGGSCGYPSLVFLGGNATQVTCGHEHCCALLTTLAVRCWGENTYGQVRNT